MSRDGITDRTRALGAAFKALLGAAAVVMLVLLSYDAWHGARAREAIEANTALLVECTTDPADRQPPVPAREDDCYVQGQDRTAEAVSRIGDLSVIAAACGAANPGDIPATRACVERALDQR